MTLAMQKKHKLVSVDQDWQTAKDSARNFDIVKVLSSLDMLREHRS